MWKHWRHCLLWRQTDREREMRLPEWQTETSDDQYTLYPAAMSRLPTSIVMLTVPISTMSITERHALTERRSLGHTKLPAALLMMMVGRWPSVSIHSETASRTECGSRTSHFTANTYINTECGTYINTECGSRTSHFTANTYINTECGSRTSHFTANTYINTECGSRTSHFTANTYINTECGSRTSHFTANTYINTECGSRTSHFTANTYINTHTQTHSTLLTVYDSVMSLTHNIVYWHTVPCSCHTHRHTVPCCRSLLTTHLRSSVRHQCSCHQ